jgi:isoleucyl-tRNA synthetase
LSNLYDFEPAAQVPYERLPELDRWALLRLGELMPRVKRAYDDFEFHAIFHALNNFCAVDLSAIYLDILKDRLYTFRRDSLERRASQTALAEILLILSKLMAPILTFTADEIWRALPAGLRTNQEFSVHTAAFPEADPRWVDTELAKRWESLLEMRTAVQAALEVQRRDKVIGSSLEARVVLYADPERAALLRRSVADLPSLFIVSQVEIAPVAAGPPEGAAVVTVEVVKASGTKCERCWNYRDTVGASAEHPTLCDRCVEAIR